MGADCRDSFFCAFRGNVCFNEFVCRFCDIVGVVSGSAGSVIALYLAAMGLPTAVASVLIAAFTSAFMIGGKAVGKSIAIEQSANIVLFVGKAMALFESKKPKRKKNRKN